MPFVGAIIADCWWGRFNTILVFSLVYLYAKLFSSPQSCLVEFISIFLPGLVTRSLPVLPLLLFFNIPALLSAA